MVEFHEPWNVYNQVTPPYTTVIISSDDAVLAFPSSILRGQTTPVVLYQ